MRKPAWTTTIAWEITLTQLGRDKFVVQYGSQRYAGDYGEACHELGKCIMHALACEGKIDNRAKGEK